MIDIKEVLKSCETENIKNWLNRLWNEMPTQVKNSCSFVKKAVKKRCL